MYVLTTQPGGTHSVRILELHAVSIQWRHQENTHSRGRLCHTFSAAAFLLIARRALGCKIRSAMLARVPHIGFNY